jgi:hypothetical protein
MQGPRWRHALLLGRYRLLGYGALGYLWALCVYGMGRWWNGEPGAAPTMVCVGWCALGVHMLCDDWPCNRRHRVWPFRSCSGEEEERYGCVERVVCRPLWAHGSQSVYWHVREG